MTDLHQNPFGSRIPLDLGAQQATIFHLPTLAAEGLGSLDRLPFSIRVLLENALRSCGQGFVTEDHVRQVMAWGGPSDDVMELPFMPARVVLQDFTGVPCVVDLAAMRDAMARMGGDPDRINPVVPCDLVIDHSVQVDHYGSADAFRLNVSLEFDRNRERYQLLKFSQRAFRNFRVVPPGRGIVHQVNLEYLAPVVQLRKERGAWTAFPDTLVGTDSHTTMINGLGVLGWGVGGIEAEAVMLGQPYFMLLPEVIGMKLVGSLPPGTTATDLVLRVTNMLRAEGVVDKFVEFFGPGLGALTLADRATIANMAPEYGATAGFFPVDQATLTYLERTGREPEVVTRVERYCKEQGLFHGHGTPDPSYTRTVTLDLDTITPSLAGPRRPQDIVPLTGLPRNFSLALPNLLSGKAPEDRRARAKANATAWESEGGATAVATAPVGGGDPANCPDHLTDGDVVIAAITSCTNTSNPSVMVGAGLLAQKALARGLQTRPWVKTSLAPGSRVVTEYLTGAGLLPSLEALGFQVVGYGCTTCIGNSGPLPPDVADQIETDQIVAAAVLSGNRNFEARIHPLVRANYLASPMLVVAFALAGRITLDLTKDPLGHDTEGHPVYLKDIWPTSEEIAEVMARAVTPDLFRQQYASVFDGDDEWQELEVPTGSRFAWDRESTYVQEPPFFTELPRTPGEPRNIDNARVLVMVGDSVTTDHISPAGAIPADGPAARYLRDHGVEQVDWNTFGSRRGNHEVMMRGTFGNVRIKNQLVPGREGNWTWHPEEEEAISIYDAAMRYAESGTPLVVLAGKEYGTGSSRDWAAKGTALLGVRAVIAESYERIHRSNLVGMGVLPLAYQPGESAASLGLTGREAFSIGGIAEGLVPAGTVTVTAAREKGPATQFQAVVRLNSEVEIDYYRHGGILQRVLRHFLA